MADIFPRVASDGGSADKYRDARQRRARTRRLMAMSGDTQPSQAGQGEKRRDGAGDGGADKRSRSGGSGNSRRPPLPPGGPPSSESSSSPLRASSGGGGATPAASSRVVLAPPPPPVFGCVSLPGRAREMEDAVSLQPGFFSGGGDGDSPLHFFAVFDGHGGSHVSELCQERMHAILAEELLREASGGGEVGVEEMKAAMARSFKRMDELALAACACGSVGGTCACEQQGMSSEIVGSTAVVAVVGRDRVVVANCGDSRAVLGRGGRAFPLSSDQKPDRPDELARIEEAGGRVIYVNGARVLGILAMSRALGDRYLKPVVISEPEISVTERTPEDEFLVIASDGLWDVVSNNLACEVTRRCLQEEFQEADAEDVGAEAGDGAAEAHAPRSYCSIAAALLTRLALARRSADNISVIVVDLRR